MFQYLSEYSMFHHPLITGVVVAIVCSLLSVIVVLKRMAFIGQGISHAAFGGVGAAVLLGLVGTASQDLIVMAFCIATAVLIGVLSRRKRLEPDSAIGILLAGAMALGVLLTDLTTVLREYDWYNAIIGSQAPRSSFEQILFGSIMNVQPADMYFTMAFGAAVVLTIALLFKEILFFAFDEQASQVFGVRTGFIYYLLLILLSVTIVLTIRLVGVVLVSALLVIPGATAVLLTRRLGLVLITALVVGVSGMLGGLILNLEAGGMMSPGPCVVAVLCLIFGAAFLARNVRNRLIRTDKSDPAGLPT